jgi:hypothetical protein
MLPPFGRPSQLYGETTLRMLLFEYGLLRYHTRREILTEEIIQLLL